MPCSLPSRITTKVLKICKTFSSRPRLHDPRPKLSFLSSRRLETKTMVSRTTSLVNSENFMRININDTGRQSRSVTTPTEVPDPPQRRKHLTTFSTPASSTSETDERRTVKYLTTWHTAGRTDSHDGSCGPVWPDANRMKCRASSPPPPHFQPRNKAGKKTAVNFRSRHESHTSNRAVD